jgi:hypothetical protein
VKVDAAEVSGPGFSTVTLTGPAAAISAAETGAVSWFAFTKVVDNAVVPHCTVEPATKFDPNTVIVKAGPPAVAENGLRPEMVGFGPVTVIVRLLLAEAAVRTSPL